MTDGISIAVVKSGDVCYPALADESVKFGTFTGESNIVSKSSFSI